MGICITCLNDAIVDINGQCFECHSERKTTDVWGQKIPHLMRLFNKDISKIDKIEGEKYE